MKFSLNEKKKRRLWFSNLILTHIRLRIETEIRRQRKWQQLSQQPSDDDGNNNNNETGHMIILLPFAILYSSILLSMYISSELHLHCESATGVCCQVKQMFHFELFVLSFIVHFWCIVNKSHMKRATSKLCQLQLIVN